MWKEGQILAFTAILFAILILKIVVSQANVKPASKSRQISKGDVFEEARIFNHLNIPVSLSVIFGDTGKKEQFVRLLSPNHSVVIQKNQLRYMNPGNTIEIVDLSTGKIMSQFEIVREMATFHIGTIEARLNATSYVDQSLNGVTNQGIAFIEVHNLTNQELRLNEDLIIPPMGSRLYTGRNHFGVPYGTIFRDQSGRYQDYSVIYPISHLYYRGASELNFAPESVPTYGFYDTDPLRDGLASNFVDKDTYVNYKGYGEDKFSGEGRSSKFQKINDLSNFRQLRL